MRLLAPLVLALLLAVSVQPATAEPPADVLILHSYHQGRPWTDEIMRGMCQVLGKSGRRLSIHVEYMDLLRHPLDETRPALVRMLSAKYRYHQPDVILTSDTPAFDFMCGHGDLLFPGVPVVFCGVNEFLPSMLDGRPGFTGVAEQADLAGTLRLGLDLFPGATRIVAVADRNAATLARLGRLEQILRDEHPRLPFVSLAGLSARDTLTALAEQPASALVVYLALTQDREGEAVSPGVGLQLVRSACALPVLATADSLVAQGALGGSSVSPAQQGELAAAMALRVLAGQRPQDIPVLTRSLSRPVFNWSELQRLGISEDRLPAGSLVLNHPVPAEHRRFSVWSVLALTVSQLVTLGALFVMRRRHRRVSARQQRQYRYLRTLMDTIPAPIFFKGADGAFLGCNRAFERLSGRRQEELLGRPGEEGGPPQLADACARKDQEVLTTGRELAYEVRILDGEEREREMMVHKAPLLDAEGRATGLVAVMLDITERSRAEERLARREAHFRLLFQGMPLPTYIWRQGGGGFRLEGYNLAAEVISHGSVRSLLGRELTDVYADTPQIVEDFQRAVQSRTTVRRDTSLVVRNTGERRIFDRSYVFLPPDTVMVHAQDITDRVQAQAALAESEGRYRTLFTNSLSGFALHEMIVNADGRPVDYLFLEVNPAFEALTGLRASAVEGHTVREVLPTLDRRWIERYGQVALGGAALRFEDFDAATGKWWEVVAYCPHPGRFAVLFNDISERKRAETELIAARDAAEAATRAKSAFLATMSHEVRTPLTGVLGMLELLSGTGLDADQRELVIHARNSGRHLLGVINEILDLSRIEAGRFSLAREPVDLLPTMQAALAPFQDLSMERGVALEARLDPDAPARILGDPLRLRQVLFNLVGNAVKFSRGGAVRLEISALTPPGPGRVRLLVAVSDQGIGIDPDFLTRIFDPFTQADGSLARQYQGAGLGLGIVARLARAMEGTVCIETEPGEGTTVWVTLTAHEAPAEVVAPSPAEPEAPAAADPAVVLLAEDNRVNRILGERLLRRLGHQALTAATGVEVLEILRRVPVDCVLLDIQMPEMDGLEAARRIRAGEAGRPDVPLVAMTAHAMSGDREQFLAAGMDSYLAKPFDLADLARVLAEVLARRAGAAAPGAASGPGPA